MNIIEYDEDEHFILVQNVNNNEIEKEEIQKNEIRNNLQ